MGNPTPAQLRYANQPSNKGTVKLIPTPTPTSSGGGSSSSSSSQAQTPTPAQVRYNNQPSNSGIVTPLPTTSTPVSTPTPVVITPARTWESIKQENLVNDQPQLKTIQDQQKQEQLNKINNTYQTAYETYLKATNNNPVLASQMAKDWTNSSLGISTTKSAQGYGIQIIQPTQKKGMTSEEFISKFAQAPPVNNVTNIIPNTTLPYQTRGTYIPTTKVPTSVYIPIVNELGEIVYETASSLGRGTAQLGLATIEASKGLTPSFRIIDNKLKDNKIYKSIGEEYKDFAKSVDYTGLKPINLKDTFTYSNAFILDYPDIGNVYVTGALVGAGGGVGGKVAKAGGELIYGGIIGVNTVETIKNPTLKNFVAEGLLLTPFLFKDVEVSNKIKESNEKGYIKVQEKLLKDTFKPLSEEDFIKKFNKQQEINRVTSIINKPQTFDIYGRNINLKYTANEITPNIRIEAIKSFKGENIPKPEVIKSLDKFNKDIINSQKAVNWDLSKTNIKELQKFIDNQKRIERIKSKVIIDFSNKEIASSSMKSNLPDFYESKSNFNRPIGTKSNLPNNLEKSNLPNLGKKSNLPNLFKEESKPTSIKEIRNFEKEIDIYNIKKGSLVDDALKNQKKFAEQLKKELGLDKPIEISIVDKGIPKELYKNRVLEQPKKQTFTIKELDKSFEDMRIREQTLKQIDKPQRLIEVKSEAIPQSFIEEAKQNLKKFKYEAERTLRASIPESFVNEAMKSQEFINKQRKATIPESFKQEALKNAKLEEARISKQKFENSKLNYNKPSLVDEALKSKSNELFKQYEREIQKTKQSYKQIEEQVQKDKFKQRTYAVSSFEGTGTYERTGYLPIFKTRQTTKSTFSSNIPNFNQNLGDSVLSISSTKTSQIPQTNNAQIFGQPQIFAQPQLFKQPQQFKQPQDFRQPQRLQQPQKQPERFKEKLRYDEKIKQELKKLALPELKDRRIEQEKKSLGAGYYALGKIIRTNTFEKLNSTPVTRNRAEDIGSYYVTQSVARTFKIVKANKPAKQDFEFSYVPDGYYNQVKGQLREFRIKNKNIYAQGEQYIQKSRFLISSQSEKRQLKYFQKQVKNILR